MRFQQLIQNEVRFQIRYGIVLLYCVFTAVYLCILGAIPASVRNAAATILIFTDPAAMGLFFMGAIVLLEKSQKIDCSLAVSPITTREYIAAKLLSILLTGTVVGAVLCIFAGTSHLWSAVLGIALSSALFSLCGLIVAVKTSTLNQFVLATVPFEIVICLPALLSFFGVIRGPWLMIHPGVAAIGLISGGGVWYWCTLSLLVWSLLVFCFCHKAVNRSFTQMGGGKR